MPKKTALITGGTSGIGHKIIAELVSGGYFVEFSFNSRLDLAAEIVAEFGKDNVSAYQLDLHDFEQCKRYAAHIFEKHPTIDAFVHNAGLTRIGHLSLISETDWNSVFNVNIINMFPLLQEVSKLMTVQKYGNIIFVSSVAGVHPSEGQSCYAASKSALIALTKALGKELGRFNIRVNCISPGFIDTEMVQTLTKKYLDTVRQQIPNKRFGTPQEVANVVKFLMSDDASYINGANLIVDGGMA